jgi:hypothetical protein
MDQAMNLLKAFRMGYDIEAASVYEISGLASEPFRLDAEILAVFESKPDLIKKPSRKKNMNNLPADQKPIGSDESVAGSAQSNAETSSSSDTQVAGAPKTAETPVRGRLMELFFFLASS